jgi:flagellar hook assembly protein FlgD
VEGNLVQTLSDGETYTTGSHQIMWDCRNATGDQVSSGTYVYTLDAQPLDQGGRAVSYQERMLLMK